MKAVILAAGAPRMRRWFPPDSKPKCLYHKGGEVILVNAVRCLRESGISDIRIVVGYRGGDIEEFNEEHGLGLEVVYNENWEIDAVASIEAGVKDVDDDVLLVFGDVVLRTEVVKAFLECPEQLVRMNVHRNPDRPDLLFEYDVHVVKVAKEKLGIFEYAREYMIEYLSEHPTYRNISHGTGIALVAALTETLRKNEPVAEVVVHSAMIEVDLLKQTDEGGRRG